MTITNSDFATIANSWRENLWAGRQSPIEPTSAMNSTAKIDLSVLHYSEISPPKFWCLQDDQGQVIGTISLQRTGRREYRMRGVWVKDHLQGQGQGRRLVEVLLQAARNRGAHTVWGIARATQAGFYQKLGFTVGKEVTGFEFGPHLLIEYNFPKVDIRTRLTQFFMRNEGFHK